MRILLVEDDPATRTLLENTLIAHHYNVEIAVDGQIALDLATQFDYDLVLLDIDMPELDGIRVCQRLRTQGYQIPILLLTAKDRATDRIMGLDAGADDYMIKPFNLPELLARMRALLRRGSTTVASVVTWENLQLDRRENEIRYGQQLLRLTPKEFGILELLLLHPQRIFSRAALIDRLWERDEPPTESAISSHIKAIRQKLRTAGASQDLIETMYGFGYRLRPLETGAPAKSQAAAVGAEPQAAAETAETVMLGLWERFKESFTEQIHLLSQVIVAFQEGKLTPDLRQAAQQTAHKLVGSLGVYGFPQGSTLAKQIEDILRPDRSLSMADNLQMAAWVADLKQELNREPVFKQPDSAAIAPSPPLPLTPSPLVLVVDDDEILAQGLQAEASARSLQIEVAANLAAADQILDQTLPDVILLDLTFSPSNEDGLTWLAALKQQYPQLPVLVFTGRDSLCDRVAAARLGAKAFLQKPIAPAQIFQAIQDSLHQSKAPVLYRPQSVIGQVMVVDDDPVILHRLSSILSPWGLQVTPLLDPTRFWEVLTTTVPDLLILDVEMPGFNGIELCQVVRNDPRWGNLPILFLTAHHDAETIVQAFAVGGDDYIRKPVLEPELIARVLNRLEPGQIRRQQLVSALMKPSPR
ncbi:hypothetical protein DO97_11225 [Neosynechococcus sphagnicola sy1]|uniref:Multi-component transcriptional regulator n=1 Tax=Neosynechococcus sphagnicola sy1 TaxID=1497020 RepID=A0A098TMY8_9CYAN|nr:response regulator [Neosynechococcus sphagnicola]KGF72213.1 hypothetical protein DO97_11225 [Neosynechococcus sphagnicola sy1]